MAHNPELDHEFQENKSQQKPYIFTSGDMGTMSNASASRHNSAPTAQFFGDLAAKNIKQNGFKKSLPTIIAIAALIAIVAFVFIYAGLNAPAPKP